MLVDNYSEAGMSFTPIDPKASHSDFVRRGGELWPENGTAYLQAVLGSTLKFGFTNGAVFNLNVVDLAEYSTVVPDTVTVHFIGYRHDGGIVTADLTTDGIIGGTGPRADFQTFQFGPEFTGLDRIEIPSYGWSLDNLVVAIPEPSAGLLLLAGGVLAVALRRWRQG